MERVFQEMAEMASAYEARVAAAQGQWKDNCQGVDEILEELARRHRGRVEDRGEERAAKGLIWFEESVGYSVSMHLEEGEQPPLKVNSAAWQDDESNLRRVSVQLPEQLVMTPVNVDDFGTRVNGLIDALHQKSGLLRENPLPDSVIVSELSLR